MRLHILGCHAATPRALAHLTAQILDIQGHLFLIDCGEGTQVQLRKNKIKFSRINHIFISHLHGDHFYGLPGLIATFKLLGREKELHIHGPKGIKEAITLLLKLGDSWTNFPLQFHELTSRESVTVFEDDKVKVTTVPLNHRIYTNGFLFREKLGKRKVNKEAAVKYGLENYHFHKIVQGEDAVLDDGTIIPNAWVTFDPPPIKSYAYCSDTAYHPKIIETIRGIDVLYHESTFLHTEESLATKTKHTTARQAAAIAKEAGVGTLILGHYSSRYKNVEDFKTEAQEVFDRVELAKDGRVFELWDQS